MQYAGVENENTVKNAYIKPIATDNSAISEGNQSQKYSKFLIRILKNDIKYKSLR